jgi:hypothetical protein
MFAQNFEIFSINSKHQIPIDEKKIDSLREENMYDCFAPKAWMPLA